MYILFFLLSSIPLYGYILSVHSATDGHLCSFQGVAIVKKAVMNTHVQGVVWTYYLNI